MKIDSVIANSAVAYAAYHQGYHCLPKVFFFVFQKHMYISHSSKIPGQPRDELQWEEEEEEG